MCGISKDHWLRCNHTYPPPSATRWLEINAGTDFAAAFPAGSSCLLPGFCLLRSFCPSFFSKKCLDFLSTRAVRGTIPRRYLPNASKCKSFLKFGFKAPAWTYSTYIYFRSKTLWNKKYPECLRPASNLTEVFTEPSFQQQWPGLFWGARHLGWAAWAKDQNDENQNSMIWGD